MTGRDFHTSRQSREGEKEQGLGHPREDQREPAYLIQQMQAERRVIHKLVGMRDGYKNHARKQSCLS